ncbi:hypothetical protein ACWDHW_13440 [Streptomyces melanosporofaciens]
MESKNPGYSLIDQIVFALGSAQLLMDPETAAELEHRPATAGLPWASTLDPSALHSLISDLSTALLGYWHDDPETDVLARVERVLAEHQAQAEADADPRSPWQRATDGLNALVDAGVGFHVEPDGHIANPFGDEHIEFDRSAERWVLTVDDAEVEPHPAPCRVPVSPDCTCVPAVVTSSARAAVEKLRRTLALPGGEQS